jgi:hypothetical protein
MNPYAPLNGVLGRLAAATGALRARATEATQANHNGGSSADLHARVEAIVERIKKDVSELEDALA